MKKKSFLFYVIFIATALMHSRAWAGAEFIKYNKLGTEKVLSTLENLHWTADGPPNDRFVYIIATSWCPVCKRLYAESRSLNSRVQFRWIMVGNYEGDKFLQDLILAEKRNPNILNAIMQNQNITADIDILAYINGISNITTLHAMKERLDFTGFPTIIFYNGTDLTLIEGFPSNFPAAISKVAPINKNLKITSAQKMKLTDIKSVENDNRHYTTAKKHVYIYAEPIVDSLPLVSLPDNFSVLAQRIIQLSDHSRWIFIGLYSRGELGGWAQLSDFH